VHHDSTTDPGYQVTGAYFAAVPCWISPLGSKAILSYYALACQLRRRGGECTASLRDLADAAGVGTTAMRDGIALLVEHGAVHVQEQYGDDGARLPNVYHLRTDPPSATRTAPSATRTTPRREPEGLNTQTKDKRSTPNGVDIVEAPERADVEEVVTALAAHVRTTTSRDPSVTKAWRRDVRLMLDGPGKAPPEWSVEQLLYVIGWLDTASRDAQFWAPNILCPSKLRAQMPKLVAAIRRERAAATQPARDLDSRIAALRSGAGAAVSPMLVAAARAGRAAS